MNDDDARVARRLAARYAADTWVAICVKAIAAGVQETADARVHTPDHYLAAAWPPALDAPSRWPEAVVIGSPTATRALAELLQQLPAGARLFLAGLDDVDVALAAEILLAGDRNLEPYQRDALRAFVDAQRTRMQELVDARYTDRDAGFERFRARALGTRGSR